MEARIVPEREMLDFKGELPQDVVAIYLHWVLLKPSVIKELNGDGARLCEKVAQQPGFFLITKKDEVHQQLAALVKRFTEKVNGS